MTPVQIIEEINNAAIPLQNILEKYPGVFSPYLTEDGKLGFNVWLDRLESLSEKSTLNS